MIFLNTKKMSIALVATEAKNGIVCFIPLGNIHSGCNNAYTNSQNYYEDGDPYCMVYHPVATKVVHGVNRGKKYSFHVHGWIMVGLELLAEVGFMELEQ